MPPQHNSILANRVLKQIIKLVKVIVIKVKRGKITMINLRLRGTQSDRLIMRLNGGLRMEPMMMRFNGGLNLEKSKWLWKKKSKKFGQSQFLTAKLQV